LEIDLNTNVGDTHFVHILITEESKSDGPYRHSKKEDGAFGSSGFFYRRRGPTGRVDHREKVIRFSIGVQLFSLSTMEHRCQTLGLQAEFGPATSFYVGPGGLKDM